MMTTPSTRLTQIRKGISYLSKHLSCIKQIHLLASPVKSIFLWGVSFLQNRGDTHLKPSFCSSCVLSQPCLWIDTPEPSNPHHTLIRKYLYLETIWSSHHPHNLNLLTLILLRSRTGTVWFYTSTSNKRAAWPKLYTKSLTRDLKLMYSRFTMVRISIKL